MMMLHQTVFGSLYSDKSCARDLQVKRHLQFQLRSMQVWIFVGAGRKLPSSLLITSLTERIVSVVFGKVSRATILIYLQQRITLWKG